MTFDIVDAHGLIHNLSIQSQRLSRQFQKSLAALLKLHKHKGMHFEPADLGFVFSKEEIERFAHRASEPLAASAHRSAAGCL
jgi:hypothetical protein